jgi:isopentenyl-diphosphate Delta-isomerase
MTDILRRKQDHIDLSLDSGSQIASLGRQFKDYHLPHRALPEVNFSEIDLSVACLGKTLRAPFFIASMTGGLESGATINRHLAEAAQEMGLAMGLGSQRVTLEHPETLASFQVRDIAPDILLLANLGAVQLNMGYGVKECLQAITSVGADALYLHLNSLQEAVQAGGDTRFEGVTQRITEVAKILTYPVLVKECGNGIDAQSALALKSSGIKGIEVSGHGGTSWGWIEAQRHPTARLQRLGQTFAQWGTPTPLAILQCRQAWSDGLIIGSGGVRSGLDAAIAIALGADAVSIAQPLLKPALESTQAVIDELETWMMELKIAMFCCGVRTIEELKQIELK